MIPELYELEQIIENNQSHINDPVFNHTVSVLTKLGGRFKKVDRRVADYLAQKIDSYSRKYSLLFFFPMGILIINIISLSVHFLD